MSAAANHERLTELFTTAIRDKALGFMPPPAQARLVVSLYWRGN